MRIFLTIFIFLAIAEASAIKSNILSVEKTTAKIESHPQLQVGISGYIIHKIDSNQKTIIADSVVESIDSTTNIATISILPYSGTHQESLPSIDIKPSAGDEAIFANDYTRAMVIAPDEDTYEIITKNLSRLDFIHPDIYATYLSSIGHPTPQTEDFKEFCTSNSIGLLYIQSSDKLFTLDCKSFTLLQSSEFKSSPSDKIAPFFSRIDEIRAAWWGSGSSRLDSYEPYYIEVIKKHNSDKI